MELFNAVAMLFVLLTPTQQANLCSDGGQVHTKDPIEMSMEEINMFCIEKIRPTLLAREVLAEGYLNGDYVEYYIPTSWTTETSGGYGCLGASVRIGYCTVVGIQDDDIVYLEGIHSKSSDILLQKNMNNRGEFFYCDELSESQKYDQSKRFK